MHVLIHQKGKYPEDKIPPENNQISVKSTDGKKRKQGYLDTPVLGPARTQTKKSYVPEVVPAQRNKETTL